ncbi:PucR family transcriptional regulator [Rhodococcus aetherivorans]|uniref:PucR family transcriptional regulator n=1 Tax=Rhodococcus aetherivorans TaxID=191292 RepID=UPI001E4BAC55|nr:helix-turn-helix domain-containing protein [Rhodococcus aetherivorans]MDV6295342.1 helix-turn-helix domain-containing protein [Rhodococcus aetherivorans]UGQ41176.1 helix-turn-helix domain-containing protein [Rhodococcus aetherivorans]
MESDSSIAGLCDAVIADLDALSAEAVDRIRERLPTYLVVPPDEHRESTRQQFLVTLRLLADRPADTHPAGPEFERAQQLGRQRALQGLTLANVIESFHIGSRELWRALVEHAPEPTTELLHAGGLLWDLVHAGTTAVAMGHDDATRTAHAVRANRRALLFELLEQGHPTEEARTLAAALGLDPDGMFRAACTPSEAWSDVQLQGLQHALDDGPAPALCSRRGTTVVTVFQTVASSVVVDAIRHVRPDMSVGLGLARRGLEGATTSIGDARRALALVRGRAQTADFDECWLPAILFEHREELAPMLAKGAEIAARHPHLAEAVSAFAQSGFSASAAARRLHLHPNSLAYRLERWQQLTGWDLRTVDGLVRSMVAPALS